MPWGREPLHGPLPGPSPGRMKKRCAPAILFIGMAGVVQMELIDMARIARRYFSWEWYRNSLTASSSR
jgi:hypothetical protein